MRVGAGECGQRCLRWREFGQPCCGGGCRAGACPPTAITTSSRASGACACPAATTAVRAAAIVAAVAECSVARNALASRSVDDVFCCVHSSDVHSTPPENTAKGAGGAGPETRRNSAGCCPAPRGGRCVADRPARQRLPRAMAARRTDDVSECFRSARATAAPAAPRRAPHVAPHSQRRKRPIFGRAPFGVRRFLGSSAR